MSAGYIVNNDHLVLQRWSAFWFVRAWTNKLANCDLVWRLFTDEPKLFCWPVFSAGFIIEIHC